MVSREDFKFQNEITNKVADGILFNYRELVERHKTKNSLEEEITEDEYVLWKLIEGVELCEKLRTEDIFKLILELKPEQHNVAKICELSPIAEEVFKEYFELPKDSENLYYCMIEWSKLRTKENLSKLDKAYYVMELMLKDKNLQTLENLLIFAQLQPLAGYVEKIMTGTDVGKTKAMVMLYASIKKDKTYAPIVMEVAKKEKCTEILRGFKIDGRA